MRYVLESLSNLNNVSFRNVLVERVFLNAGSRQYSCVESDIMPFGARFRYQNSTEPTVDLTKQKGSVLLKARTKPQSQLHKEFWSQFSLQA